MSKIKKNLSYQTIYQIVITITPLITSPYLSRTLGADSQGIYSYRLSIVSYFTLFSILGMATYGAKMIAANSNNKRERDCLFGKLAFVQLSISTVTTLLYILYCMFFSGRDLMSWVLLITMVSYLFDYTWFFHGIQRFSIPTLVNTIVKILNVVLILLLVKCPDDVFKYAAIMGGTTFVSFFSLVPFIMHEVDHKNFVLPTFNEYSFHLKNSVILFIPIAAQTIYHVMDKTMLGAISTYSETGYYYNADKLVSIPIGILAGVCTVMLPRMSELKALKRGNEMQMTFKLSLSLIGWISSAFAFGIIGVADEFVPMFFGEEFVACVPLVQVLAFVIVLKSISECLKAQYLIPNEFNMIFIISVFSGAVLNLLLNAFLIPIYGAMGAVIGTICAELIALAVQGLFVFKKERLFLFSMYILGFLIVGILMCFILKLLKFNFNSVYINLACKICIGGILYAAMSVIYFLLTPNALLSNKILSVLKRK